MDNIYIYTYTYIHTYTCVYVCMYISLYIDKYKYIYIYTCKGSTSRAQVYTDTATCGCPSHDAHTCGTVRQNNLGYTTEAHLTQRTGASGKTKALSRQKNTPLSKDRNIRAEPSVTPGLPDTHACPHMRGNL